MSGEIRRSWGVPFAALSAAAFALGFLFHHQALRAAESEAARKEIGSCCHPAEGPSDQPAAASASKETRSRAALAAGVLLLGVAVAPAAFSRGGNGPRTS